MQPLEANNSKRRPVSTVHTNPPHHLTATYFSLLVSRQNISGMDECKLPSATRPGALFYGVDHSAWSVAECSCPTGNLVHTSTTNAFWFEKKKNKASPYKTPWFKDDPEGYYCLPWCCTGLQDDKSSCNGPEGYDAFPCGWLKVASIRTTLRGPDNKEGCTNGNSKRRCIHDCECTVCTPGQYVKTDIDQEDVSKDRTCTHCGDNTFSATANAKSCSPQPYCTAGQRATYTSLPIPRNTQMSCTACKDGEYKPEGQHRSNTCRPQPFCSAGQRATYTSENSLYYVSDTANCGGDDAAYIQTGAQCEVAWKSLALENSVGMAELCERHGEDCGKLAAGGACGSSLDGDGDRGCASGPVGCYYTGGLWFNNPAIGSKTKTKPADRSTYNSICRHVVPSQRPITSTTGTDTTASASTTTGTTPPKDQALSCTACDDGAYREAEHRSNTCNVQPFCNAGQYITAYSNTKKGACTACARTEYMNKTSHRELQCVQQAYCGIGEKFVASLTSERTCEPCADGFYQDTPEHFEPQCKVQPTCNKGQRAATPVSNTAEQDCVPCGEHTFQNGTDHRIAQCYDQPSCSAGFFISADSVEAKRVCTPCQASTYQAQSAHRIEQCAQQERCTLGEFYTRNPTVARACEVCAEGTYQDLPDHVADTCAEQPGCPPAGTFYAPDRNATRTCQPCPPNTHQNVSEHRIQSCGDDPTCPDSPNGIGYEYNGTAAVYGSCVAATCNGDPDPAACRDGTDVIDCSDTFLADDCKALCGTCTAPTTSTTTAATTITNTTTTLTDIAEEPSSGTTTSSTVVALASALSVCALVAAVAVTMHCRNARSTAGQGGEGRRMDAAPRQRGQTTQNRLFLHHGHAGAQNGPLQQPYSDGLSGNSDDYATIDDC